MAMRLSGGAYAWATGLQLADGTDSGAAREALRTNIFRSQLFLYHTFAPLMSDPTPPPASTSRRRRRRVAPGSAWQDIVTGGLPVLACFLGGATEKWSEGIVFVVLGSFASDRAAALFAWAGGQLHPVGRCSGCAAFAFLPADWFYQPLWRIALIKDFGIALPDSVSPQPWVTLGCLGSFLGAVCWFYYVAAQQLEHRSVRRQFRVFAGGVVLLAGALPSALSQTRRASLLA